MLNKETMPRILYIIVASNDPTNELDLSMQRKTWLKSLPKYSQAIVLRGQEDSFYSFDGETLHVPCPESYDNILRKTILGFKWVIENLEFDLLIRTNVSTYYSPMRASDVINRMHLSNLEFGGFIERSNFGTKSISVVQPFVTGTGIFLTKRSVIELTNLNPEEFQGIPEDLSISRYLVEKNSRMVSFPRINLHSTHLFLPGFQTRLKSSEISELASRRFQAVFNYYEQNSLTGKTSSYFRILKLECSNIHYDFFHLRFYFLRNIYLVRLNLKRLLFKRGGND